MTAQNFYKILNQFESDGHGGWHRKRETITVHVSGTYKGDPLQVYNAEQLIDKLASSVRIEYKISEDGNSFIIQITDPFWRAYEER